MKRTWIGICAVGCLSLAAFTPPLAGQALAAKKLTYLMAWIPDARWAPEAVATYRGYFKAEGLDVTIKWAKGSRNAGKQTATGGAEFGSVTGSDVMVSREKGVPLVTILQTHKAGAAFISLKKAGIRTARDFIGKKVGVQRGSATWIGFLALMAKNGIDVDKVKKIQVGFGFKPLLSGVVDVRPAMIYNEVVLARHKGIPINVIWIPEQGIDMVGLGVATTEQRIKRDPATVRGFVRGVIKGYEHAKRDPDDAVRAVVQHKPDHDPVYQRKVLNMILSKISVPGKNGEFGWIDRSEWSNAQESMIKFGAMKKRVNVDDAFTNRFVAAYYGK